MIKNLVFDFGNVLLQSDFAGYLEQIILDPEQRKAFADIVFTDQFTVQLDMGMKPSAQLFEELSQQHPELKQSISLFQDNWMDHLLGEMPGMYELLAQYKSQGYRLLGLSNWSDMIYPVMEKYPIFQLLEGSIISSEVHLVKPDPAIYRLLCNRFQLVPSESLFVDDKLENVISAREVGMTAIHFQDPHQFAEQLKQKG